MPRLAALAAALTLVAGCGGGTTTVRGKVAHAGKPVVWGSVTLMDEKGMYHQGPIALDGTYTIEKVPPGPVKIGVFSPKPEESPGKEQKAGKVTAAKAGAGPDDPRAKFKTAAPDVPKPPPGAWLPIPDKFTDPTTSGLTGVVQGSPAVLDINIE